MSRFHETILLTVCASHNYVVLVTPFVPHAPIQNNAYTWKFLMDLIINTRCMFAFAQSCIIVCFTVSVQSLKGCSMRNQQTAFVLHCEPFFVLQLQDVVQRSCMQLKKYKKYLNTQKKYMVGHIMKDKLKVVTFIPPKDSCM